MPDLKAFTSGRDRSCVMRNNDKEVKIQYASMRILPCARGAQIKE